MLSDRSRELLTSYVDGELTSRQRLQVRHLLEVSPEAGEFLRKLQEDAARLRALPPPTLDCDLSGLIVDAIQHKHGRTQPARRRPRQSETFAFPARSVLLAAASVLLIVTFSSVVFLIKPPADPAEIARHDREISVVPSDNTVSDSAPATPRADAPRSQEVAKSESHIETADEAPAPAPAKPAETKKEDPPVLTAPSMELFQPERVRMVALPVVVPLREIGIEANRDKLLRELRDDAAFRVELPCQNATRAFEKVQSALRSHGVGLVIEQTTLARLRQPLWKTNYVLFAEDITADELHAVLREIAATDGKARAGEAQFTAVVVTHLSKGHRKELSDLLGVDPEPISADQARPLGVDPHKPLPEVTAGQVANALSSGAGQGGATSGTPAVPVTRQALALAFNPVRPRQSAPEIRRFLDARKPARPGSLQLLIVLRGA
jgi:hypothetical protein